MQIENQQAAVALSWSLQSALVAGLGVTSAVLAITFRRAVMYTLTAVFGAATVASVLVWASLTGGHLRAATGWGLFGAALTVSFGPGATGALLLHLVRVLASRASGPWPHAGPALAWCAAVGAGSYAIVRLASLAHDAPVVVYGAVASMVSCGTYSWIGWYAWRAGEANPGRKNVFRLVAAALGCLGLRATVNLVIAGIAAAAGTEPAFPPSATGVQVFLLAISGVLLLVAVLDEERALAVQQAEQLRSAQLAMASSQRLESLGRMAGAVAHDFNNVLTVISVSTESARAAPTGPHDDELRDIHEAARRGQALTKQLIAFARSAPQSVVRFDAGARTRELRGLLDRMAGQQVSLDFQVPATAHLIEMDPTQFEQVLMNLVANGRDAAAPGGHVRVEVGPASERPGGSPADDEAYVRVTVMDNGTGIASDVLPHIFEPFFSTKRVGEGSGLGLATCERIVRAAGGRIDVRSDRGSGTRFDVLLPRARE